MFTLIVTVVLVIYGICFITAFIMGLDEQSDAVRNSYSGNGTNIEGAVLLIGESLLPWRAISAAIRRRQERIQREKTITRS